MSRDSVFPLRLYECEVCGAMFTGVDLSISEILIRRRGKLYHKPCFRTCRNFQDKEVPLRGLVRFVREYSDGS